MKLIKNLISYFTKITTGILLICCFAMKVSEVEMWTTDILWHIPLLGFITAVISVFSFPDKDYPLREGIIRYAVHFLLITATVLTFAALFGWYEPSVPGCLVMMIYIAAVYGFSCGASYLSSRKSADELNKALEKRKQGK